MIQRFQNALESHEVLPLVIDQQDVDSVCHSHVEQEACSKNTQLAKKKSATDFVHQRVIWIRTSSDPPPGYGISVHPQSEVSIPEA